MVVSPREANLAIAFFCLFFLSPGCVAAEEPNAEGRLAFSLTGDCLEALVNRRWGYENYGGISFSADEEGAEIKGGFSLVVDDGDGEGERPSTFIAAGPGRASGCVRFLSEPLGFGSVATHGGAVALDSSLASATVVLGAGAKGISAFALAKGSEAGLILRRGTSELGSQELVAPRLASAGIEYDRQDGVGRWSSALATTLRSGSAGGGGWEPKPPPESPGLVLLGALAREWRNPWGSTWFGLAASAGALEGPGLAARLEAEARQGPFLLRLAAAEAGMGFRSLSGSPPDRSLAIAADIRLALRRATALGIALRLESPRLWAIAPPRFGSSARFSLTLPLGESALVPRLEIARQPGEEHETGLGLALKKAHRDWGTDFDLSFGLGGETGLKNLKASLSSRAERFGPGRKLGFGLELGLSCLEGGERAAPVRATFELSFSVRLPSDAELWIKAASPEKDVVLAPITEGAARERIELSLRYIVGF